MADDKAAKLKALQLTLDKLDKTYGKGSVMKLGDEIIEDVEACLLYTSPSPRDLSTSRMPSSA